MIVLLFQVVRPTSVVETLSILSIEESKIAGNLTIFVKEKDSAYPREVTREAFMEKMPIGLHDKDAAYLRQCCPMEAKAHTTGSDIKRILIHHFSETDKDEVVDFTQFGAREEIDNDAAMKQILEQEFDDMEDI